MRIRYLVLGLLVLLSVVTYMDRVCISVAAPRIREEFGISPEHWGFVLGAFTLAYGAFEIPSGACGDRFGERRMLTRIVVWWSAFTVLTGLASGFAVLVVTRFLFGVGEAGAYPNAAGSIRRWFPMAERARAQGFVWGASRVGGALTPIVVVPLMLALGWRTVFFLFGAVGLVWAIVWWAWYGDRPAEHAAVTSAELAEIDCGRQSADQVAVPWGMLFRNPQMWLIMAMYACYACGPTFFIAHLPDYLIEGRGLSEKQMARFAGLPFVAGAIGNLVGGYISDRWSERYGKRFGRGILGAACLALAALLLGAAAIVSDPFATAAILTVAFGVLDCMLPCAWALCLDIGGSRAGAVSGAMNSAGQAGGFLCNVLFGYLIAWYGDYSVPLLVIAFMVMASSVLFLMIDPTRPLVPPGGPAADKELECASA
jgi:MFS family permease